jgi:hypothetical protein
MAHVTDDYVNSLPAIYRDILAVFPDFEPTRKVGYGLALQSIFARLEPKYTFAQIKSASEQMQSGGAVEIKNRIFVCPTEVGEEIIAAITGRKAEASDQIANFPRPPA